MPMEKAVKDRGRRYPVGAELIAGKIDFRVWAPGKKKMELVLLKPKASLISMHAEEQGYFSASVENAVTPMIYQFRVDGKDSLLADPASRFQPQGPTGPSEVIDPSSFKWTDSNWKGIHSDKLLIYEMHIGTFTQEGTWASAAKYLPELAEDGVNVVETMPIADFGGKFGWGYDGVNLFAPYRVYGRPDDLRSFIDKAHQNGIGVILDIVYNHLGPAGNDLPIFCKDYLTDRYTCEWGDAINFDGRLSGPVRDFYISNARYWIEEYHFDGFRIDATQQIFDSSDCNIIAQITIEARKAAADKKLYITGENEPQKRILLEPTRNGGYGLDALWNDDFHHAMRVILTGRSEAYLSDYSGTAQEILSAAKYGFLYQGQFSRWQKNHRGTNSRDISHRRLICYLQNHDQIANSAWGYRMSELTSAAKNRAAIALLLLGPWTPMIFQGQEFNASTPFLYFADHPAPLATIIAKGRKLFLSQFPGIATEAMLSSLDDPCAEATFCKSKLSDCERHAESQFRLMFRILTKLRKTDEVISSPQPDLDGAVLSQAALVLRYFSSDRDRLLVVNFGANLFFSPAPEPLLACLSDHKWRRIFSSEDPQYGGSGTPDVISVDGWRIPAECTILFEAVKV